MKMKTKMNYLVDLFMLLTLLALAGSGLLLKYVLLSGQAGMEKFGYKVDMGIIGIYKESWELIHFYLGLFLLILLLIHILQHLKGIKVFIENIFKNKVIRSAFVLLLFFISIMLLLFPFILEVQVREALDAPKMKQMQEEIQPQKIQSLQTKTWFKEARNELA